MQRAEADVGLMFTAYTLKRIMNILEQKTLKAYLRKLSLFSYRINTVFKSFLRQLSNFIFSNRNNALQY